MTPPYYINTHTQAKTTDNNLNCAKCRRDFLRPITDSFTSSLYTSLYKLRARVIRMAKVVGSSRSVILVASGATNNQLEIESNQRDSIRFDEYTHNGYDVMAIN